MSKKNQIKHELFFMLSTKKSLYKMYLPFVSLAFPFRDMLSVGNVSPE